MSSIPARSRSLRKPAVGINNKQNGNSGSGLADSQAKSQDTTEAQAPRSISPSKLPVKPFTSSRARTGSTSTNTSTSTSRIGTATGTASSSRPPRSITTRPPISSDNHKPLSLRSKTPDAASSSTSTAASTIQRKPSVGSTSASRHTRNASASTISSTARAPTTSSHTRATSSVTSSSTSTRPPSQTKVLRPPSQNQILRPPSTASTASSGTTSDTRPAAAPPRPTFTTLQQHFSPAKSLAPKPASSTFYAPPSPSKLPSNIAITAETARLQAELLQLHLLHRDAETIQTQYHTSARLGLEKKFNAVREASEDLRYEEVKESERQNLEALKVWKESGVPGWGIEEKIQVLDEILAGIWKLSEHNNSRYGRSVRKFEKWIRDVEVVMERRSKGDEVIMLDNEGLDEQWREDCEGLSRKIGAWRERSRDLGDVGMEKSALKDTVEGCKSLVEDMYTEIQTMLRIEKEVGKQEREWISRMCDQDSDDDGDAGRTVGGAWRL